MPRVLTLRLGHDSVAEFEAAANQRYYDGLGAATQGRRTAAIYLWGYTAEMIVKAAYFRLIGFAPQQHILFTDLQNARNRGHQLLIPWPKQGWGHNVAAWSQLVILERAHQPQWLYPNANFGVEFQSRVHPISRLWRETLRYHKNVAYSFEVLHMRECAEWLLTNMNRL